MTTLIEDTGYLVRTSVYVCMKGKDRRIMVEVKVQETRTVPEQGKQKTGDGKHHGKLGFEFYDHQPSSSTVGDGSRRTVEAVDKILAVGDGGRMTVEAIDTILAVGDGGRVPAPLDFDAFNPFPFARWGLCIEFQTPLGINCARAGFVATGVVDRLCI